MRALLCAVTTLTDSDIYRRGHRYNRKNFTKKIGGSQRRLVCVKIKTMKKTRIIILITGAIAVILLVFSLSNFSKKEESPTTSSKGGGEEAAGRTAQRKNALTLIIPALNLSAPIIEGVDPSKEKEYNQALTKGVALLPTSAKVGESGNVVIYGHSSAKEKSPYQRIFASLNDLEKGGEIIITSKGQRFAYLVTGKRTIEATELSVLAQTKKEQLTLLTCWPIGTDKERLVITALRK